MNPEGTNEISEADRIESLRLILEREQGRSIAYSEALEVAESLISFYEVLAAEPAELELVLAAGQQSEG